MANNFTDVFNMILAEQARKERKEDKQQEMALHLLSMDLRREESALDREVTLLDRQIARNEKRYDKVYDDYETTKDQYEEATGSIYKLSAENRGGENAINVANDVLGGTAKSLNDVLIDIKSETGNLQTAKTDMESKISQSKLISDFYKGYGHDFSKGDPERWDIEDFSEESLAEYVAQYPELEDVNQEAFYKGLKTREEAGLFKNIASLNVVIDQTKTAKIAAATKELEYNSKFENIDAAQLEKDIDNIDSGVHSMISKQATSLNTGILSPAISTTNIYATAQEGGTPSEIETAKGNQEAELAMIGSLITGNPKVIEENLRLGRLFVSGNANYVNSIDSYLKGSGELNYSGWIDALQEVDMYNQYYKSQLEAGAITPQQYLAQKNNLEMLLGDDMNNFSNKLGTLIQASEAVENKGQILALKGMQNTISDTQSMAPILIETIPDPEDPIDTSALESLNQIPTEIDTTEIPDPTLKSLNEISTVAGGLTKEDVDDIAMNLSKTVENPKIADILEKKYAESGLRDIKGLKSFLLGVASLGVKGGKLLGIDENVILASLEEEGQPVSVEMIRAIERKGREILGLDPSVTSGGLLIKPTQIDDPALKSLDKISTDNLYGDVTKSIVADTTGYSGFSYGVEQPEDNVEPSPGFPPVNTRARDFDINKRVYWDDEKDEGYVNGKKYDGDEFGEWRDAKDKERRKIIPKGAIVILGNDHLMIGYELDDKFYTLDGLDAYDKDYWDKYRE